MKSLGALFAILAILAISVCTEAQTPKLMIPIGHSFTIPDGCFSPDGKIVATAGSFDGTARLWDASSGDLLMALRDDSSHTDFNSIFFSPDGRHIVTTSVMDMSLQIWDAGSGRLLSRLKGHRNLIVGAELSPDGSRIVSNSFDSTARVWETQTGKLLFTIRIGNKILNTACFSADGQRILTAGGDNTAALWDATNGKKLQVFSGHRANVIAARFSPDNQKVVSISEDTTAIIWETATGKCLHILRGHTRAINTVRFSPDGQKLVTASSDSSAIEWEVASGKELKKIQYATGELSRAIFSRDGREIITTGIYPDSSVRVWDAATGALQKTLAGHTASISALRLSPDGTRLLTTSNDRMAIVWDLTSGSLVCKMSGRALRFNDAIYSPDGHFFVTTGLARNASQVWDAATGKLLYPLKSSPVSGLAHYSPDGKMVLAPTGTVATIWDAATGDTLYRLNHDSATVRNACFSHDGKTIATVASDSTVRIWDAMSGKLMSAIHPGTELSSDLVFLPNDRDILLAYGKPDPRDTGMVMGISMSDKPPAVAFMPYSNRFYGCIRDVATGNLIRDLAGSVGEVGDLAVSPDGSRLVVAYADTLKIFDLRSEKRVRLIPTNGQFIHRYRMNKDGSQLLCAYWDGTVRLLDASTGEIQKQFKTMSSVSSAGYSPDERTIITTDQDNSCKRWDVATGDMLYSLLVIDSADYLVTDRDNRYDGTETARKLLYFTCGQEIVGLDQVKDQLWVPNLASRILTGDSIEAPRLTDLQVCGYTPTVETGAADPAAWHFAIRPRLGGLGATVLYVNGNETHRYQPTQLKKTASGYTLDIPKISLHPILVTGRPNPITVKAFAAGNDLSSRGATIISTTGTDNRPPSLYAVMIGVSDYKGDALDLKYAAKDANDLSRAVRAAATKWLGADHVFMYNLTTDKTHYRNPEKAAIRQTIATIGQQASANDILLIFFAGHGIMAGDKVKQFYFLTADASPATTTGPSLATVGISARELTTWIQPANIKAQKRILILDACNSGQAINDIVHVGNKDQRYIAARNDEGSEQTKSIDKLNEHAGLFILAASASDQSAYEMGRYSQGLLTYALLKAIKEDPAILENDKYLNVEPWFDHARNTVTRLVRESGARQEPQMITNTNFNIGIVDTGVIRSIHLAAESALFTASNFQNRDESVGGDDLDLTTAVNHHLGSMAGRGAEPDISYSPSTANPDAWHLIGNYTIDKNAVSVMVNIWHSKKNLTHFSITGTRDHPEDLADGIVKNALDWIAANNPKE